MMRLELIDHECPYCGKRLEEDLDKEGKLFRFCDECGKSFEVEED